MLKLIIEDDEGRKTVVPFVRDEITIGRQEGNTIRLTERNVSRRHARLVRQSGHVLIEDLGSYNGTRINGERIQGPSEIHDGDLVQIGDYDLALQTAEASTSAPARAASRQPEDDEAADEAPDDEHDDTPPPASAPRQHSTAVIRMDQVEMTRSRKVVDLDPEKAPRLVVLSTDFKGAEFACIRTELRLGRTDDNDISIDHRSVSSTHAKLVREDNGEWRIIDMQSANGLTVNGETYAQSALRHGDIIELGHVKLKFIGAGKATGNLDSGGRSKLPLVLGIIVVLAGLGAGGFFVLKPHLFPASPTPGETPVEEPQQAQAPTGDEPATPPPPAPPARDDEQQVAEAKAPEAPAIPQLEEKLQGAREAMEARRFDQAVDILESIKDARGKRPAEAETLLDEARAEVLAKKGLAQAHRHLEAGRLDAAAAALDGVVTHAFEEELSEARAKLAAARAPKPPRANENTAEAGRLLSEASKHIKGKEYQEAATLLERCLKLAPSNADCHLWLGVSYAGLGDIEKGAKQYRKFYELAPNHPQAPRVKEMLDAYEKQKQAAND